MLLRTLMRKWSCISAVLLACALPGLSGAQQAPDPAPEPSLNESVHQLQAQIQQLQVAVQEIKQEAERYRAETLELEQQLDAARQKPEAARASVAPAPDPHVAGQEMATPEAGVAAQTENGSAGEKIRKLEEDDNLLNARVAEQYQTKVESASKYRVRLSGLLLFNLFSNQGNVDHMEVPGVALASTPSQTGGDSGGSFGATFRQSEFGVEVNGPDVAGARTEGNFVADFFGEFPETVNGSASGTLRLRTGTVRLDWDRTSLVGGIDNLFFSPLYPTSFASVGIPPLSYSGNLYAWTPQLRVEHRMAVSESSTLTFSGGIFDPLSGETPPNEFLRTPDAGESSRQPGYGSRMEWSHKIAGQPLSLSVGGYYSRQNWFNRNIDGWAATGDWNVPFGQLFSLSGKFYSGNAIGGLGAGIGRSVVWNGAPEDPNTIVRGLRSTGGWSQLKFKPLAKLEFNAAAGQDGVEASALRGFTVAPGYFNANITRNRSEFGNLIYRPRSNLVLSTEFRSLRTFTLDGSSFRANQLNLIMGVFF